MGRYTVCLYFQDLERGGFRTMFSMEEERRVVIAWRTTMMKWADMRALEKDKGLRDIRCEPVRDKVTGEP